MELNQLHFFTAPFVVWGGNVLENSFPDYENGNRPHLI